MCNGTFLPTLCKNLIVRYGWISKRERERVCFDMYQLIVDIIFYFILLTWVFRAFQVHDYSLN